MSEPNKDPAIKLFGAKIPLPETKIPAATQLTDIGKEMTRAETESSQTEHSDEQDKSSSLNNIKEEGETPVQANEVHVNARAKADQAVTNTDQEKVFKRPDKILPCPRCNSLDTKFCYFNNYNVNQPRHFCKNCQRYWTAGGTMRSVPVGAGRRKNKHFASQYRQVIVSPGGVPIAGLETPNLANHQIISCGDSATTFRPSTGNGTVLKFGPEAPSCESMETVLNLRDQKRSLESSVIPWENRGEPSACGSSMTGSSIQGNNLPENAMQKDHVMLASTSNELNTPNPLHCYPVPPWGVRWNPGWNNLASIPAAPCSSNHVCVSTSDNASAVQRCPTPLLAVPGFCLPNIPLQFVPASYWACMTVWAAGAGNVPLTASNGCLSPSSSTSNNSCCSGNGSPTLGKHSRDPNLMEEDQSEKCILVPKTLRIDDPDEASKSPIWATLGIKPEEMVPKSSATFFKGFEPKKEGEGHVLDDPQILGVNPAALLRSHTFQEST